GGDPHSPDGRVRHVSEHRVPGGAADLAGVLSDRPDARVVPRRRLCQPAHVVRGPLARNRVRKSERRAARARGRGVRRRHPGGIRLCAPEPEDRVAMISRIWHGWTSRENAAAYEELLKSEILPAITGRGIRGLTGAHLMKRDVAGEVEFVTILWFESIEAV